MDAFASYRTMVDFTSNCSGASADHAYLASGPRPPTVYTLAQTLALLCVAVSQLVLGTAVDYMDKRKLMPASDPFHACDTHRARRLIHTHRAPAASF